VNYLEKCDAFRGEIRVVVRAAIKKLDKSGTIAIGADNLWQLINLHHCKHGPRGPRSAEQARREFDSVIEEREFRSFIYEPKPEPRAHCVGCGCSELLDDGGLCVDCRRVHMAHLARMDEPRPWQDQLANMENPPL
jgi:hypothetical protein